MQQGVGAMHAHHEGWGGQGLARELLGIVLGVAVFCAVFTAAFWIATGMADLPATQGDAGYLTLPLVWSLILAPCLAGLLAGSVAARFAEGRVISSSAITAVILWVVGNWAGMHVIYRPWKSLHGYDFFLPPSYVIPGIACVLVGAWMETRRQKAAEKN